MKQTPPRKANAQSATQGLKEKKRAQNREAQRRYREGLRERLEELERFKYEHSRNESGEICSNNEKTDESPASRKKATTAETSVMNSNGTKHQRVDSTAVASNAPQHSDTLTALVHPTDQQLLTPNFSETYFGLSFPDHVEGTMGRTYLPSTVPPELTETKMYPGQYLQDTSFLPGSDVNDCECIGRDFTTTSTKKQRPETDFDVGRSNKQESGQSQPSDPASTSSKDGDDDLEVPDSDNSVEDRIQYLLDCAQQVGFEDFEAALSAYYTVKFESTSPLVLEQRMSRIRRLPNLLADLRRQAPTWRRREQRGYQDEVIKAAEEVCAKEYKTFLSQSSDSRQPSELASLDDTSFTCRDSLEEELPHLWEFLATLTAGNTSMRQRNRYSTVRASIFLLCHGGSTPSSQGNALAL